MRAWNFFIVPLMAASFAFGQSAQTAPIDGSGSVSPVKGITPPSPLTVQHALSFGMSSGFGSSSLQSQGLYSTMMQYKFSAPVTLNLNFSLPIYSTYSHYQTPSASNIKSLDYFRSMPFDVGLNWKPTDNLNLNISVVNRPWYGYGVYGYDMFPWR